MINTRHIAAELRLSHWAAIMREQQESGLSKNVFCKQNGIIHNTFYYWQKKLREAACEQILANSRPEPENSTVPAGWAVCEVSSKPSAEEVLPIEINGCRILVSAGTDPELLAKTCKVLMSLC